MGTSGKSDLLVFRSRINRLLRYRKNYLIDFIPRCIDY